MSHKKRKIEAATPEEVERYAGQAPESESKPAADEGGAAPAEAAGVEGVGAEAQEWKDRFLRAKADLANFQRRMEKEQAEAARFANAQLIKSLLPVLDDLERVIAAGEHSPDNASALLDGVKLTLENFLKAFQGANVERIEAEGRPFDPQMHDAMMEQASADHPERTVLREVQKGYRLYDRVLRPARVIVSKPQQPAEEEAAGNDAVSGQADEDAAGGS
jgi:molecular chaperone GrpE